MSKDNMDSAFRRTELKGSLDEPAYSGALSFMRRLYSRDLDGVDLAIAGVPFDCATTNRPGTRFGPRAIREASSHLAWDPAWGWKEDPFDLLSVVDYGDFYFNAAKPATIPDAIERQAAEIVKTGTALLTFGGDHFITYPLLKAHVVRHGPLALLHFDAHTDTWVDDKGDVDHGTMFYHAINDGLIDVERSVQVGIRTTNEDTMGVRVLDAEWIEDNGIAATVKAIRETVGESKCYLTFDIDCLDPAFAPGTGTPVPGGLTSREVLAILKRIAGLNLVGSDVVEVAPAYDISEITALAGATIAVNQICLLAEARKRFGS